MYMFVLFKQKSYLDGPLGELARVISKFVSKYSSALRVQFLAPLHSVGEFRVPLVQRFDAKKLGLVLRTLHYCIVFASSYQHLRIIRQIKRLKKTKKII